MIVYYADVLVAFNIIVLLALFLLLIVEEVRHRRFARNVYETREGLLSLAHQLRSPLAALKKYHEFLRSNEFGKLSFSQQEALSRVYTAFGETTVILERLLARSRIDDTSLASGNARLDFVAFTRAAIQAVTPSAEHHGHRIIFSPPQKKIFVKFDPLLLHGILDELLMNAILYMKDGGTVQVSLKTNVSTAEISVKDGGIGISESEKGNIFQKFFRGKQARTLAEGNGLGLSFAKQLAQLSGGSIRFVSKEGIGSTFTLALKRI